MSEITTVEIDKLSEHPSNARKGDIPKIMRSLERFGQVKPIIVQRSTGYIVAGNHVTKAAMRLGWTTIQAVILDMDDDAAIGYLVSDNSASDSSAYDRGKLLDVLTNALSLEGLGFDEDDLEAMREEQNGKKETKRKPASSVEAIEIEDKEATSSDDSSAGTGPVTMREIPLRMPASDIQEFSKLILDLQRLWSSRTLVEVVSRAVSEAHGRWQAQEAGGRGGSAQAIPEFVGTDF